MILAFENDDVKQLSLNGLKIQFKIITPLTLSILENASFMMPLISFELAVDKSTKNIDTPLKTTDVTNFELKSLVIKDKSLKPNSPIVSIKVASDNLPAKGAFLLI